MKMGINKGERFRLSVSGQSKAKFFLQVSRAARRSVNGEDLDYYFAPEEDSDLNSNVLSAYPNPSHSGWFEVSGLDAGDQVQMVNSVGQTVEFNLIEKENARGFIDLGKNASGLYLLKVTGANGTKELNTSEIKNDPF